MPIFHFNIFVVPSNFTFDPFYYANLRIVTCIIREKNIYTTMELWKIWNGFLWKFSSNKENEKNESHEKIWQPRKYEKLYPLRIENNIQINVCPLCRILIGYFMWCHPLQPRWKIMIDLIEYYIFCPYYLHLLFCPYFYFSSI